MTLQSANIPANLFNGGGGLAEGGTDADYGSLADILNDVIDDLEVLDANTVKNNFAATTSPLVTSDSASGYGAGSLWVNQTLDIAFVCMDASVGAAIWKETTQSFNKLDATAAPAVGNDNTEGYQIGSLWVDVTHDIGYIAVDVSTGAAVWLRITTIKNNFAAVVPPAVGDDNTAGYEIGSMWVDTAGVYAYICIDATTGAAVWRGVSAVLNNFAAVIPPVVGDDSTLGYSVGSRWIDTALDMHYVCMNSGVGAAIWRRTNNVFVNYAGAVAPVVGDDSTAGYEVGSIWIDAVLEIAYICTSPAVGAAIWRRVTLIPGNYAAVTDPAVGNDDSQGYEVGSVWINVTRDIAYKCLDATTGVAVWERTTGVQEFTQAMLFSDFPAAAINVFTALTGFPTNTLIFGGFIELDTDFSGGGVASATASIGDAANPDEVAAAINVFTAAGAGNKAGVPTAFIGFEPAYAPGVEVTVDGAHTCSQLLAGALVAHVFYVIGKALTP